MLLHQVDSRGRVLSTSSSFNQPIGMMATSDGFGLYVGGAYVVDYVDMTGEFNKIKWISRIFLEVLHSILTSVLRFCASRYFSALPLC